MSDIPYTVRRSTRARRVRVNVHAHTGVEVVLPVRAPERAAQAAVIELRPWIERRLAQAREARELVARRAGTVPYLGHTLALVQQDGRSRVHRRGDELLVPAGPADRREAALERWYRAAARREFEPRLEAATARSGRRHSALTVRAQRTRWGSCSAAGRISLNWRLLLAPERVLEYVIWHEVCHLEVMDHSPRFWRLLESHRPGYRSERDWLRRYGATLVLTP